MVLGFRKHAAAQEQEIESGSDAADISTHGEKSEKSYPSEGKTTAIDASAAVEELKKFEKLHKWDPNLPQAELDEVHAVLAGGDIEDGVAVEQALLEEDSPYPEVRAAVRNYDEGDVYVMVYGRYVYMTDPWLGLATPSGHGPLA